MNGFDISGYMYSDLMPINNMTMPGENTISNQVPNNMMNSQMINPKIANPNVGYRRGNMFDNLYEEYKNYQPAPLTPSNEQEELFLRLSELSFAAHEANLYLDVFPDNKEMIARFNEFRSEANKAVKNYEEKYGPITLRSDNLNTYPWAWESFNWPWDEGGM